MKNIRWTINVLLILACCACAHNDMIELDSQKKGTCFTIPDFAVDGKSRTLVEITDKAAVFSWAVNDTIGIFPDTDASQARFSMISGAGTKTATFDGGGWALKSESKYAAYYPYIPDIYLDKTNVPVDYTGQTQVGLNNTGHLGKYDFMAASAVIPVDGEAIFNFVHLNSLLQLKLKLPKAGTYSSVTLKAMQELFPVQGRYNLMSETMRIEPSLLLDSLVLHLENVSTSVDGEEVIAYLMMAPTDLSNKEISVIARDVNGICAEGGLQMKNLVAGTAYSFSSVLKVEEEGGDEGGDVEDGVTIVDVAGSLEGLLREMKFQTSRLAIKGKLNSDDVALLRRMSGGYRDTTDTDFGILKELDLSRATLVPGGSYYLDDGKMKYKIASSSEVGDFMFFGCNGLEFLTLPDGVTSIGEASISNCNSLRSVVIPNSVIEIGVAAFKNSGSLNDVQLPSELQELGTDAFHSCFGLQRIVVPAGVASIGSNTFGHCSALKEVVLSEGLISIGSAVFAACSNLEEINIPNSVETIGERAFGSCTSLTHVILSSGMTNLGSYVFENCTGLQSVILPEGMTTVESRAFSGCSNLKDFTLPSTLKALKDRAFYAAALMSPVVVRCNAENPPTLGSSVWKGGNLATESKLYVPSASIDAYRSSSWADYFGEILSVE